MSVRSTAMRGISAALFHTGLVGRIGATAGYLWPYAGYRVLTFHRVDDENDPFLPSLSTARFAARMAHIARHYTVLPLEDLAARVRRGAGPRNALAITFDDGYRSNLTHAAPILSRYGLPATIFLVSSYIGTPHALWFDRLALALKNSRRSEVRFEEGRPLPLTTVEERLRALTAAQKYFKTLPYRDHQPQLDRVLANVRRGAEPRSVSCCRGRAHSAGLGFSVGPIPRLTPSCPGWIRMTPDARSRVEAGDRASPGRLTTFAYPNGGVDDYTGGHGALVSEAGFVCGHYSPRPQHDGDPSARASPWRGMGYAFTLPMPFRRHYQLTDGWIHEQGEHTTCVALSGTLATVTRSGSCWTA
jgi:hypothetical protein